MHQIIWDQFEVLYRSSTMLHPIGQFLPTELVNENETLPATI